MKALLIGTALFALAATAAAAAPPPAFLAPPAACAKAAVPALPFALEGAAAPEAKTFCAEGFCDTVADCWSACPTAYSAHCVSNNCNYTYGPPPTGGGGPGGGGQGPFCPDMQCLDNSQCVCGTYTGVCVSEFCQF